MSRARWAVVVPVKDSRLAKSRLQLDSADRRDLARAMLLDTLDRVLRVPSVERVVLVCDVVDDGSAATALHGLEVLAALEPGMNQAIRLGEAHVRPDGSDLRVAALPGDLPALDPDELAVVLDDCADAPRSVLADRQGTGTTLLTAAPGTALNPCFGQGSFLAHIATGARPVQRDASSTLRRDVDRLVDLRVVARRAPGSRTAQIAARVLQPSGSGGSLPAST